MPEYSRGGESERGGTAWSTFQGALPATSVLCTLFFPWGQLLLTLRTLSSKAWVVSAVLA